MKAAQYNKYGSSEVIVINGNAPRPQLKDNQVLVEVHAASINPIDWKVREGFMKDRIPLVFPVTIGGSFSGIVLEIGMGVTLFKPGDEVFGQALVLNGGSGSLAELVISNEANTALKPKTVSHIEAASLPLVGASAIQAIEQNSNLQDGQKILIHGGAGGIGSIAIQLAKSKGAYVATTVSGSHKEFVRNLGADLAIDYKNEKFEDLLEGYDAVFDTVGGETTDRSFPVLKKGGIIVSMAGKPSEDLAKKYDVKAIGQNTDSSAENLSRLAALVDNGIIKAQVDTVFPLEKAKEAFDFLEKGHPRGKVVLEIKK